MPGYDEAGRFIPVAPGWVVQSLYPPNERRRHNWGVQEDMVGWLLITKGDDSFYVPCTFGDDGLEPHDGSETQHIVRVARIAHEKDISVSYPEGFNGPIRYD